MKAINRALKTLLFVLTVVVTAATIFVFSMAASDEYKAIVTQEYGELEMWEHYEKAFSFDIGSKLKINLDGADSWGGYFIEIKNSKGELVYNLRDETEYADKEHITPELPKGDYVFYLYCDDYFGDELEYNITLSYLETEIIKPESIKLSKKSVYLCKNDKATLAAEITPARADGKIKWSSSDEKVAVVSEDGTIKAVAPGKTTITATIGDVKASCKVTVFSTSGKTFKAVKSDVSGSLEAGKTKNTKVTLKAYSKIRFAFTGHDADYDNVTYGEYVITIKNSEGKTVYTVSGDSSFENVKHTTPVLPKGTYTVTLSSLGEGNGLYHTRLDYFYTISYMTVQDVTVKKVKLSSSEVTLSKGKAKTLTATPDPSYATYKVKWSSSDEKVASVSSDGKITAKGLGTATITAKIDGKKASCKVKVTSMALTAEKSKSLKLTSYITNIPGYKNAVWKSSDNSIATVNSNGKITAKAKGSCSVYCTVSGVKYTFKLTVKNAK